MFDRTKSKVIQVRHAKKGKRYQVLMGYRGCPYVWNMHNHDENDGFIYHANVISDAGHLQCYCEHFLVREVE